MQSVRKHLIGSFSLSTTEFINKLYSEYTIILFYVKYFFPLKYEIGQY